ncbi:olfactory receptor class A-like protein 1 isoform X2 [Entelurus aequoreus]|uniref:olfactory receptor class A-like protein 1 isoform X2 n=1 Tax=Entelurus aequoreus TaxID=161455 RepID=UPI002B1E3D37|nr:olfactory receptor class A-like protein 1 isoform X2 [Entelurus aequoreus]
MDLCVTIKGVSFLLQTGMGILGNTVVLLAYAHIIFTKSKLLPVDMILCHLAFANLVLLLTRGVPQTMTVFGRTNLLNDPGCKAVTVAPAGPRLSKLKSALHSLVFPTFAGLWLLNSAIYFQTFFHAIAPRNGTIPAFTLNLGFCHLDFKNNLNYVIKGVLASGRDFFFVALMVASSGYILLLLHRHSRQVRAVHRSQGGGAETRAIKTVVTLVVLYVFFFGIDNVIWIYMLTEAKVSPVVTDMKVFFSSCFAFLSPYFIISSNKKVKAKVLCAAEQDRPPSMDTQEPRDKGLSLS